MRNAPDFEAIARAMADAIAHQRTTRGRIGRDARMRVTAEFIEAEITLDATERAYREAANAIRES